MADEGTSSGSAQTGVRARARAGVRWLESWAVGGAQWRLERCLALSTFAIPGARLGRPRRLAPAAAMSDCGRVRPIAQSASCSLLLGRPRARLVGSGVGGRDCCDRGDLPAAPAARLAGARIFRGRAGFAVATIKATLIAHPILRFPAYSVAVRGLCRAARRKPEVRPLRAAARAHRRQPHCRQAAAHPAFRPPRHGAAGRRLRRGEGAA